MYKFLSAIMIAGMTVSYAQAGFELVFVADNGPGPVANIKIKRFDPQTGLYLGSFGTFTRAISTIWLDPANQSLFVISNTSISEWDFNTGLLKNNTTFGLIATGYAAVRPDKLKIALFDNYIDFLYCPFPTVNGFSSTGWLSGSKYQTGIYTDQNHLVAFESSGKRFINFTFASNNTAQIGVQSNSASSAGFGQIAKIGGSTELVMASHLGGYQVYTPGQTAVMPGALTGTIKGASTSANGFYLSRVNNGVASVVKFNGAFEEQSSFGSTELVSPIALTTHISPD